MSYNKNIFLILMFFGPLHSSNHLQLIGNNQNMTILLAAHVTFQKIECGPN